MPTTEEVKVNELPELSDGTLYDEEMLIVVNNTTNFATKVPVDTLMLYSPAYQRAQIPMLATFGLI